MIYLIVLVILLSGLFFFEKSNNPRSKSSWLFFEWVVLVLLAGLRYKVGGDTIWYYESFANAPTISELSVSYFIDSEYNFLWIILTAVCKTIYPDFVSFQIVHAIIVNTAFFMFFKRYIKKVFLAVLIYFVFYFFKYNTEILRASLAVSVFLFSFKYLENKNWSKYLLCAVIAMGFHSEAIVMVFFPLVHILTKIRVNLSTYIGLIVIAVVLMSFNFIPAMKGFLSFSEKMTNSIDFYANKTELGENISLLGYGKIFVTSSIWLVIIYALNKTQYKLFRGFAFVAYIITWLSYNYSNIFYRVLDFTQPILIVSICLAFELWSRRKFYIPKMILSFVIVVMLIDLIEYYLSGHFILFYPYSSVLDPVDYSAREFYFNSLFQQ